MPTMAGSPTATGADAPIRVIDLRGMRAPAAAPSILVDPSGRRARRLRVAGRILGSLFMLWLCGLLLAGLGLLPVSDIPFAGAIRAAQEPAQLSKLPSPRSASEADLRPARPLSSLAAAADSVASGARRGAASARSGGSVSARGGASSAARRHDAAGVAGRGSTRGTSGSPSSSASSPGNSANTPSATGTTPSSSTSGKTHGNGGGSTTTTGNGSGHGQSTAPHGSSGAAPGHDPTRTTAHGKPSV
ncbi:MAG: hypothetical protein QOG41_417 [Thermoleophilaceae bacterium]|nr:hypothetical protein [Thermoleophilaceae bacterium]